MELDKIQSPKTVIVKPATTLKHAVTGEQILKISKSLCTQEELRFHYSPPKLQINQYTLQCLNRNMLLIDDYGVPVVLG